MFTKGMAAARAESAAAVAKADAATAEASTARAGASTARAEASTARAEASTATAKADRALRTVVNPLAIRCLLDEARKRCRLIARQPNALSLGETTASPQWAHTAVRYGIIQGLSQSDLGTIFVSVKDSFRGSGNFAAHSAFTTDDIRLAVLAEVGSLGPNDKRAASLLRIFQFVYGFSAS